MRRAIASSMSRRAATGSSRDSPRRASWLPSSSAALNDALPSSAWTATRYHSIALSTSRASAKARPKASATAPIWPQSGANFSSRKRILSRCACSTPPRLAASSPPKRRRIEIVSSASVRAGGDETPANSSRGEGRRALRVAAVALPGPARVAVALVRRPGVAAIAAAPGRAARRGDGVDEAAAAEQRVVEGGREHLGRLVLDGPAGGDDAAHADLDQRLGDVGGERGAVVRREQRSWRRARRDGSS